MYLINKNINRILPLEKKSFKDLGFTERNHLQEWLANNPEVLGEDILIIQKEFSGFNDTNERLDLLGIDKQGNLVIIENKLDDTGKDVTWQVLKYASYCSTLNKDQIKMIYQDYLQKIRSNDDAEANLLEFFNKNDFKEININTGQTQRIIMVAGNFRKEVTSTVLWLLNYKLRIQCLKVTPYQLDEQLFLDIEQIIPMKETEEYIISMADKTQDEINVQEELKSRHYLRIEFWKELLNNYNKRSTLFQSISPSKDNWIGIGAGISGVSFNFVISNSYARVELYISRYNRDENKAIFDELYKYKSEIESMIENELEWERLDNKKACRIKLELKNVDYFDRESWPIMIDFLMNSMDKMEKIFKQYLQKIKKLPKTED